MKNLNTLPAVVANEDRTELMMSIKMFGFDLNDQPEASSLMRGMRRDAAKEIVREFDELFEEIQIEPAKCDACFGHQKCVEHFRAGYNGAIHSEFDSLFLGQFSSNHNR